MNDRYKQVITLGYFALVAIALIVVGLIIIFRPDATPTLMSFVGTVLAVASTAAVTFYMLGKQNQEIASVKTQTNGTLTELLEQNKRLTAENAELKEKE